MWFAAGAHPSCELETPIVPAAPTSPLLSLTQHVLQPSVHIPGGLARWLTPSKAQDGN